MSTNEWLRRAEETAAARYGEIVRDRLAYEYAATPKRWTVAPAAPTYVTLTPAFDEAPASWWDEMLAAPADEVARVREAALAHMSRLAVRGAPAPEITSELVENAIERIQTDGWTQRNFHDGDGAHCAIGALGANAVQAWQYRSTLNVILPWEQELMKLMGIDTVLWNSLPTWNDAADRTKDQVLDALMLAAKKLRDMGR